MSSFGPSKFGGGMKSVDRPSRGAGAAAAADLGAARPKPKLKKVLPEVWQLIKPRRWLLGGSFLLMVINRASGLILPASTKYQPSGSAVPVPEALRPSKLCVAGASVIETEESWAKATGAAVRDSRPIAAHKAEAG